MSVYLNEDMYLFYLFIFAIILSVIILGAYYVLSIKNESTSKITSYECGFYTFEDARNIFDVHFYLVAILFLVLDLEVMFLFPWAVSLNSIGLKGFIGMVIFLLILTIGFFYEWKLGALEWSSQQSSPNKLNNLKRNV
jgi:NADH-quinone oxidoreductase subunit A